MTLLRVAAPLASLFFFFASALAQISAPNCTLATYGWTYNSLGQNPCTVAALMMATCNGSFAINALSPGNSYSGPDNAATSNYSLSLCYCNTVTYSLFSACDACQGAEWISWSQWTANCPQFLLSLFPHDVPEGTALPRWALIDVASDQSGYTWNSNLSHTTGDSPEVTLGSGYGPSSGSSSGDSPPPPASGGHSLNTAVIASSVSSGVVTICLAIASIFCYLRRRRRRPRAPPTVSTVPAGVGASKPQVDEILLPVTYERISLSGQPRSYIRMVDPNDPTTFPENAVNLRPLEPQNITTYIVD